MKQGRKLEHYYTSIFFITSVVAIAIVILFVGWKSSAELREKSSESLKTTAQMMGEQLDQHMWARYKEISMLASLDEFNEPSSYESRQKLIDQFQQNFTAFSWIGMTDESGKVINGTNRILEGESIAERPVFLEAQKGPFIGDVHEAVLLSKLLPNPSGEPLKFVDISLPLKPTAKGTPVLASHLSWEWAKDLKQAVLEPIENSQNIELYIVSGKDNVILLGPTPEIGKTLPQPLIDSIQSGKTSSRETKWLDGETYLFGMMKTDGYKSYNGLDWVVLARQSPDIAFAPARNLILILAVMGILLAAVAALLGRYFARRIAKPVQDLSTAADQMRLGERTRMPFTKGIFEFEQLSSSLQSLVDNLRQTKVERDAMEEVAYTDHLTGLPNRFSLKDYAENVVNPENETYLLYLDLDGFKPVNDTFGHEAGDRVLQEIANRMRGLLTEKSFVARLGGDEFIFITEGNETQAEKDAQAILEQIRQPFFVNGQKVYVGVSIGAVRWESGMRLEQVMHKGDLVLYQAKRNGKNQVRFFKGAS